MIAFFDPKRGAEIEQEVIDQRVLINSLIAKIERLDSRIDDMTRNHQNAMRNLSSKVERIISQSRRESAWGQSTSSISDEDFKKRYEESVWDTSALSSVRTVPTYDMATMRTVISPYSSFSDNTPMYYKPASIDWIKEAIMDDDPARTNRLDESNGF